MFTKEAEILQLFAAAPFKKFTTKEIFKAHAKKSKSYIEKFLKKYMQAKIIQREKIGNINTYHLNIQSTRSLIYAGMTLENYAWSQKNIPYKDVETLIKKSPYKNQIVLITGSYANKKENKKSDLDMVIIVDNNCETQIKSELKLQAELNIPPIHLYIFKNKEFLEMLTNKELNYGKEIVKNCLILTQGQTYLKIIVEAMQNGFTNKPLS